MVSVIIPCYNYGHLIADTINSILQQTYKDIEIIVVNDGSKDNTEEVVNACAQKDARVTCYTFPNTGLGASRNRGLEKAKGDFIQFLDADDLLEKRKFDEQLKIFAARPEVDVVYGSVRYFTKDPYDPADRQLTYWGPQEEWMPKVSGPGRGFLAKVLKGNFSHLSSPLFRRGIVEKVGLFDNSISAVADYHFLLRCAIANANFYYHDTLETYSLVRWHPDNMSKDPTYMRGEEIKMRNKLVPLLQGDPESIANNESAIKGLTLQVNKSWKQIFLSGGPFDFIKKGLRAIGIEKLIRKVFYK
ncbi:MAG: glycosyltransferase [Chitinophagaceae bacterium]